MAVDSGGTRQEGRQHTQTVLLDVESLEEVPAGTWTRRRGVSTDDQAGVTHVTMGDHAALAKAQLRLTVARHCHHTQGSSRTEC